MPRVTCSGHSRFAVEHRPRCAAPRAARVPQVVVADEDHSFVTVGALTANFDRVFASTASQTDVYEYIR